MKITLRVLTTMSAVGIMLLLANCSKDKDPVPADLIIGKWEIASFNLSVKVGSQTMLEYLMDQGLSREEAQQLVDDFESDYLDVDGSIEIKKGGTYTSTDNGSTDSGTWELSADGKTLTFDKADYPLVFTITTLTSTNLNMTSDDTESDGGVTVTMHIEIKLTK
jgi:hypothetical protein